MPSPSGVSDSDIIETVRELSEQSSLPGARTVDIADDLDRDHSSIYRRLKRLADEGRIDEVQYSGRVLLWRPVSE